MRLSPQQIDALQRTAAEVFGPEAQLRLFGSRVDDQRQGGDIDLYVSGVQLDDAQAFEVRLNFLVKAKQRLGDQRIDLVICAPAGQEPQPIQRIAESTGILLQSPPR